MTSAAPPSAARSGHRPAWSAVTTLATALFLLLALVPSASVSTVPLAGGPADIEGAAEAIATERRTSRVTLAASRRLRAREVRPTARHLPFASRAVRRAIERIAGPLVTRHSTPPRRGPPAT